MSKDKAVEFIRKARKGLESEIVCPRKYGICKHDNENCPIYNLDQALTLLQKQPPAGKFTKAIRASLVISDAFDQTAGKSSNSLMAPLLEACVRLDQQAEDNKNQAAEIERLREKIGSYVELGKRSASFVITIVNLKSRIEELEQAKGAK